MNTEKEPMGASTRNRIAKNTIENGTFDTYGMVFALPEQRCTRPCPVCSRVFMTDGFLDYVCGPKRQNYFLCQNPSCNFAYPVELDDEEFVKQLAEERIAFLSAIVQSPDYKDEPSSFSHTWGLDKVAA